MAVPRLLEKDNVRQELECLPNRIDSLRLAAPPHCHDYFEFFLIVAGRCLHLVNGQTQPLAEGDLVFIRPDDIHSYAPDGADDCAFINLTCSAAVIRQTLAYLGGQPIEERFLAPALPPSARLSGLEKESYIARFERLQALGTLAPGPARLLLRSLLVESFTRYFLTSRFSAGKGTPLWLDELLTRMQRNENFTAGLPRLYALSARSPGHVDRTFRRYLHTTPSAYVNRLRLDYARTLLLTTGQDITTVALEAGFETLSHFYHLFCREYAVPPGQLRRE